MMYVVVVSNPDDQIDFVIGLYSSEELAIEAAVRCKFPTTVMEVEREDLRPELFE